jgi:hypothetical protein
MEILSESTAYARAVAAHTSRISGAVSNPASLAAAVSKGPSTSADWAARIATAPAAPAAATSSAASARSLPERTTNTAPLTTATATPPRDEVR